MAGIIAFFCFIAYGFYDTIKHGELFSPITLLLIGFLCIGLYCLKMALYEATYIYIDKENRTIDIKTRFKGDFKYSFSDITLVFRKNVGARLEFQDGTKIELNKVTVIIETSNTHKQSRNIEKDDLPGVYFIEKL